MLELTRENIDKIIRFVQDRFGELTGDEIRSIKETPEKLSLIIEEKFGVPKSTVNDEIREFLGKDIVGGMANIARDLLGGLNR